MPAGGYFQLQRPDTLNYRHLRGCMLLRFATGPIPPTWTDVTIWGVRYVCRCRQNLPNLIQIPFLEGDSSDDE